MQKKLKNYMFRITVVLVLAISLGSCHGLKKNTENTANKTKKVAVAKAGRQSNKMNDWSDIISGFQLSKHYHHARVKAKVRTFKKQDVQLKALLKQAAPMIGIMAEEIAARGLPMELIFLPLVESRYNPEARSSAKAVGLWQLRAPTGKRFGVSIKQGYDGRKDILTATDAALNYLEYQKKLFKGDWLSSLAAYNAGEGRVLNARKKQRRLGRSINYWSLPLPKETKGYLPKLLALAVWVKQAERQGALPAFTPAKAWEVVKAPARTSLKRAAKATGTSYATLKKLNAGYAGAVIPKNKSMLIPAGQSHKLRAKVIQVANLDKKIVSSSASKKKLKTKKVLHRVRKGDSLFKIAKRYQVKVSQLMVWNTLARKNMIRAGQTLTVYPGRI